MLGGHPEVIEESLEIPRHISHCRLKELQRYGRFLLNYRLRIDGFDGPIGDVERHEKLEEFKRGLG